MGLVPNKGDGQSRSDEARYVSCGTPTFYDSFTVSTDCIVYDVLFPFLLLAPLSWVSTVGNLKTKTCAKLAPSNPIHTNAHEAEI
jgi:hypothetical protein